MLPFLFLLMGDNTSLPLAFLWQPLALLACHITPSPLCCLSSSSFTLSPCPCLLHCRFHSVCVLSVVFYSVVITGQPKSHFLQCAVCLLPPSLAMLPSLTISLTLNHLASVVPMAILHHLYTQDMLSLTDITHNTLHGWCFPMPSSLSPAATRIMWEYHMVQYKNVKTKHCLILCFAIDPNVYRINLIIIHSIQSYTKFVL